MDLGHWNRPVPPALAELAARAAGDRLAEDLRDSLDEQLAVQLTDDHRQQLHDAAGAALRNLLDPAPAPAPPRLVYTTVDDFVRDFVCQVFRRNVGPQAPLRWSATWWESAEAIMRLEAMWRSWEHLRLDPALGVSAWLREHADYHLSLLMAKDGPFKTSQDTARHTEPLPYQPPPPGLFR
jgi:hypothetical protein